DEISEQQGEHPNLYIENRLDEGWVYAKVIFTCRTHYLPHERDHIRLFAADPSAPLDVLNANFSRYYLAPFSAEQIRQYLTAYLLNPASPLSKKLPSSIPQKQSPSSFEHDVKSSPQSAKPITLTDYERYFRTLPGLQEMVRNPFIL